MLYNAISDELHPEIVTPLQRDAVDIIYRILEENSAEVPHKNEVRLNSYIEDDLGGDSLDLINILEGLEHEFGVVIDEGKIKDYTVRELTEAIFEYRRIQMLSKSNPVISTF